MLGQLSQRLSAIFAVVLTLTVAQSALGDERFGSLFLSEGNGAFAETVQTISDQTHTDYAQTTSEISDLAKAFYNRGVKRGKWAAAGFKDTELGVWMKPEVTYGATTVYAGVQA